MFPSCGDFAIIGDMDGLKQIMYGVTDFALMRAELIPQRYPKEI